VCYVALVASAIDDGGDPALVCPRKDLLARAAPDGRKAKPVNRLPGSGPTTRPLFAASGTRLVGNIRHRHDARSSQRQMSAGAENLGLRD